MKISIPGTRDTLNQAAGNVAIRHAIGQPSDKVVMLVGHDDQLPAVGGLLGANCQLPGFAWNDTPPGGACVVRVYYTVQLD